MLSVIVFFVALGLLITAGSGISWLAELGKSMLGLSMTAIIGGFVKMFIDDRQREKEALEKELQSIKLENEKRESAKKDILDRVRQVFDKVDTSRLLINAHRSAKTYSEQMRSNIIPSIPVLFDIKRTLVGSGGILRLSENEITLLRIDIHYMVAYLTVLSKEYEENYLYISRLQYFQEAAKEEIKKRFQNSYNDKSLENLPALPDITWKKITALKHMEDFLSDSYDRKYNTAFTDRFDSIKKILRGLYTKEEVADKLTKEHLYVDQLRIQDQEKKKEDGKEKKEETTASDQNSTENKKENLVLKIMREKLA